MTQPSLLTPTGRPIPPDVRAIREARLAFERRTPVPATVAAGPCPKNWGWHHPVGGMCRGCGARA